MLRDQMELAGLAHRRYPDVELPLAIRFFESDRSHAGLGALDERKRSRGGEVSNYKYETFGKIVYHLVRKTRDRWEYPRAELADIDWTAPVTGATMTVQRVMVPGRNQHLCVDATYRELREQSGRRRVAAYLREARRQLFAPPLSKEP